MFAHTSTLTVPWGDRDPAGIVFYPRFFAMFDAATAALIEAATGRSRSQLSWPMIDTRAVFYAPVRFDEQIAIDSQVVRLGNSSFEIGHWLCRSKALCVTATETRVWAAAGEGERAVLPRPLPDAIRAMLADDGVEGDIQRGE